MTTKLAYSVAEAAESVGLSRATIERAIHAGHLPTRTTMVDADQNPVGKRIILRSDLEAWLRRLPAA